MSLRLKEHSGKDVETRLHGTYALVPVNDNDQRTDGPWLASKGNNNNNKNLTVP